MTAPRWIANALESIPMTPHVAMDLDALAAQILEHLPVEAIAREVPGALDDIAEGMHGRLVADIMRVLTDGDPEVVSLTELYQGACRALDAAGVPYAIDVEIPPHIVVEATIGDLAAHRPADVRHVSARPGQLMLDLAGRIAWLAQQRPTRLDLQRVEAERDRAQKELAECYATIHSHQQRLAELHCRIVELERIRPDGATP